MNSRNKGMSVLVIVILALAVLILPRVSNFGVVQADEKYDIKITPVKVVKIIGEDVDVRADPKVLHKVRRDANTYGTIGMSNFTIKITQVYTISQPLDDSGEYYGLPTDEILLTPEGNTWFPFTINGDKDGIVWINRQNLQIIA